MEVKANSAFVILDESTRKYFTGFSSSSGCVVLTDRKKFFLTDGRYFESAKSIINDFEIILSKRSEFSENIIKIIKSEGIERIYLQDQILTYEEYISYKNQFSKHCKVQRISNKIDAFKAIKQDFEIKNTVKAQKISEQAFWEVLKLFKEGITERDVAIEFEYRVRKLGAELAFESIVSFSENTSKPHYFPSDRKLKKDDIILMDIGAKYNGYCSDMTRTFVFGKPKAKFQKYYAIVADCVVLLEEKLKSGLMAGEIDKLARDYFDSFGVADKFIHGTGHGVGLAIHEYPSLSKDSKDKIKQKMITTIEPGLYFEGEFGIRIEDLAIVKKNDCEIITKVTKDLTQFF